MAETGAPYETSYFSAPAPTLDPKLFDNRKLKAWVSNGVKHLLFDHLNQRYRHPEIWAHPWLAGSGVSYQWSASRQPGDLDCLVGVDYLQFRKANPEYIGLSDTEISGLMNEQFREELQPMTENWHGYELTFYVNPGATDIRTIRPYAAYSLKYDEWTVPPDPAAQPPENIVWEQIAKRDLEAAETISLRFNQAYTEVKQSRNDAMKRNAETRLEMAQDQALALWDDIHSGRKVAFSADGEGYEDFHNWRWQAAKRSGAYRLLRLIKDYEKEQRTIRQVQTYGVDLPDADVLRRRAATYRLD